MSYSAIGETASPPGGRPPGLCFTNTETGKLECPQHPVGYYVGWGIVTVVVVAMFYSLVRKETP